MPLDCEPERRFALTRGARDYRLKPVHSFWEDRFFMSAPQSAQGYVCERKFSGEVTALDRVIAVVGAACAPDDKFAEGVVNSIYFDTPSLLSYSEKANGDNLKTKLRVRWYGRDDALPKEVPVFVELKRRIGGARDKERIETTAPRDLLLDAPFEGSELRDFIMSALKDIDIPSPLSWFPSVLISYSRLRYYDHPSQSRVSIDWDIRAPRFNGHLFPTGHPIHLDSMVCEYKNDLGAPPPWAEEMRRCGLRFGSFSKFGECVSRLASFEQ